MKRIFSIILAIVLVCSAFSFTIAANAEEVTAYIPSFIAADNNEGLYVHGVSGEDTEAWQYWQKAVTEEGLVTDEFVKYFFLPSGASDKQINIYNNFDYDVVINDVTIKSKSVGTVSYSIGKSYNVKAVGDESAIAKLCIMKSSAESAIYVNNLDADGNGTDLYSYLCAEKSNSAKATGAIVDADGNIDNTTIKKIKGRGNTTWSKPKKPFNITYDSSVSIGGMNKSKKFSLLANYQDASLCRNRILYDLSDAVGLPYASDSRFVDFYINGVYQGSYQCAQKIEVGSKDVVNDIDDGAYLSADGTLAENFPFLMEIDPSFDPDKDFHVSASSNSITIKAPELTPDMDYYYEVGEYVKDKFGKLATAINNNATEESLSKIMDIDSFTKLYLINELSKNWDSGVSSLYMVYKQDSQGEWKFFASPVWDYDNSLGNCTGVASELRSCGVKDYEEYTGWWCKYKGKRANSKTSSNIMNRCANCPVIQERAATIWFKDFVPALKTFNSTGVNDGEIYSNDVYYSILKDSADMNYTCGWLLNTGGWIADHSKLAKAQYNFENNSYTVDKELTYYDFNTFKGEYDFTVDWMNSRAAWLSDRLIVLHSNGDVDGNGKVDINDVTLIQKIALCMNSTESQKKLSDINLDGKVNINDVTVLQKRILLL